jgi:hypothetical protein
MKQNKTTQPSIGEIFNDIDSEDDLHLIGERGTQYRPNTAESHTTLLEDDIKLDFNEEKEEHSEKFISLYDIMNDIW